MTLGTIGNTKALLDCYLLDIFYLSEAFWGARMGNCDIQPTDGTNWFAYLRTSETSIIDWRIKLRKKDEKWIGKW